MATSIKDLPNFPEDQKKQIEDSLASLTNEVVIKKMLGRAVDSVSWNHAKILAVNGKTLLTGGGIYCELYADNVSSLHDLQAKVKGDAAVSAHAYCNYFWEYVSEEISKRLLTYLPGISIESTELTRAPSAATFRHTNQENLPGIQAH
jgi:hypothetical protein